MQASAGVIEGSEAVTAHCGEPATGNDQGGERPDTHA